MFNPLCNLSSGEKVTPELVKMFDQLRETIATDLHLYYTKESQTGTDTNRILKMMSVVNAMKVC